MGTVPFRLSSGYCVLLAELTAAGSIMLCNGGEQANRMCRACRRGSGTRSTAGATRIPAARHSGTALIVLMVVVVLKMKV